MDNPIVVAIVVFVALYVLFFLVRVLADMYLVGVALVCAVAAYHIPSYYGEFVEGLNTLNLIEPLGVKLPETADTAGIWIIAVYLVVFGLLACLPALPFSATYRYMLGVDRLTQHEERKIRHWINEEFERIQDDD